jgi:prophage regulatory protein
MAQAPDTRAAIGAARHSPAAGEIAVAFLRLRVVIRVTGLSRSTLYRLIANGQFPRPVRLGPRAVAWRRSDVEAWSDARPVTTH